MLPLDIIVPTQMQLDRIILNQTRLQINMRPVYTDIELYRLKINVYLPEIIVTI